MKGTATKTYWPLPDDLDKLHEAVIQYAVDVNSRAASQHETTPRSPLAHGGLFTLQWRAIVIHRAIRVLCVTGWTPAVPVLVRTLLDIVASCLAIVMKPEDTEYMGFKFMGSYLIQAIKDPDTPEAVRKFDEEQLEKLRGQLHGNDLVRGDRLIREYRPQPYWYRPECDSPGPILKNASTEFVWIYRTFSGAVHGGFLGSALFDEIPDKADINPHPHPRRTRVAIIMSYRILLEISYLRDQFEGTKLDETYKKIMKELYLPQKDKVSPTATD
jgi:hypothetical protein